MEENEVIKQKENGNYLLGTIGAILGGIIGAIPWALVYYFANLNTALLAILVGFGAIKGYTLFKGKFTKKTKILISLISLIVLVAVDLIGLPLIYAVTYSVDLKAFYTQMKSEIIHDLIFTVLFGFIGIGYAINKINTILAKQQIEKNKPGEEIDSEELRKTQIDNSLFKENKNDIDILRKVFERLNAFDKKTAVEKQLILEELEKENIENAEKLFKSYKRLDIIKKSKGKFYYSVKSEKFATKGYWIWYCIILFVVIFTNVANDTDKTQENYDDINTNTVISSKVDYTYDFNGKDIQINVPSEFVSTYEEEYDYYVLENENTYAIIYLYPKAELVEGLTLADCTESIEDYIYGIFPVDEQKNMEIYTGLNKSAYKLSFDAVDGIYNVKINSYITETQNYIVEMHMVAQANKFLENENKYEEILNSLEEKTSVEE